MIGMSEYAKRRHQLMKTMTASDVVILPAANEVMRNGDSHYAYRQNSDFYYLTGFDEPEAMLVLTQAKNKTKFTLFNRVRDPSREVWDGPRAGQAGAVKLFGADASFPISTFENKLAELIANKATVYYPIGRDAALDAMMMRALNHLRSQSRQGIAPPEAIIDVLPLIHELRLFKSADEIKLMQKAVDITASGHIAAMEACRPGMNERELDAILTYEFMRRGAKHTAYTSIVGAGKNACVLHYIKNDQAIKKGDLVLIDAGAEVDGYASDITRTFPASGKFSVEQHAIYDVVLGAQLAAINAVKVGAPWSRMQEVVVKEITYGLVELGVLKGRVNQLIADRAYAPFYMHSAGHWLGLDVHDAGEYKVLGKSRPLQAGMVLTVEPGIYISANNKQVHKRWHNIGVRIEDDVLVTKGGPRVLSEKIPKTVTEIEAIMGS